jgi:hypothetical protein
MVIHLDGCALEQALAPGVFHLNYHAFEHALATRIFRLNGRDSATRIFHLNHPIIKQVLAPDRFANGLESGWHDLRYADCPILTDQTNSARR